MTKNINRKLQNLLDGESSRKISATATSSTPVFPVVYQIETTGGATGNVDTVFSEKVMIIDVYIVSNGTGTTSDTIQVTNGTGSNHITNAMSNAGAAGTVVAASTLSAAHRGVNAGSTVRVTETDGGGNDCPPTSVYIIALKVA